jgi:phage terminase large subunit GpA-like protein
MTRLATEIYSRPLDLLQIQEPPPPQNLFVGLPLGEEGETFDLDLSPWTAAVMNWWIDPSVDWIHLIQGSQTSKTTTMMGLLLYCAKFAPGPAMWIAAVEEEAEKFATQRLKPFLEAADPLTQTRRKRDWRAHDLRIYGRMLLHMAWATSAAKLRGWPCQYLFGDEVGIWPAILARIGDVLEYAKKRTRRYRLRRKGIFATTPSSEEHPSWQDVRSGNFAQWWVPCPECGEFQFLDFARVKFAHCKRPGGTGLSAWDLERVARDSYYQCPACNAEVRDVDRAAMIRTGRLQFVDVETGEPCECDAARRTYTLHVPATYSLFTPLGSLAVSFLSAKHKGKEALRVFVTDELAKPWREATDAPTITMAHRAVDRDRPRGTVPDEVIAVTAGVDVHHDLLYYVVRGWSCGPEPASWQIAYGQLPVGQPGHELDVLDDVLSRDYRGYIVDFAMIDAGWKPEWVYPYCQTHAKTAPSKGVFGARQTALVRPSSLEHAKDKTRAAGLTLYLVNSDHFKGYIHEHMLISAGDPGCWRLCAEAADDEIYIRQILAESRVPVTEGGRTRNKWIVTDKAAGNHYLDCEVYAAAAAWFPLRVHRTKKQAQAQATSEQSATETSRWIDKRRSRWLG